ncbi:MAG: T9SS type A sorting domain-containing protein, partial [Chitinophagales bacterium]|nr:T9SS type A sorting domain-containing protein [Chitinophagales bacterium]
SSTSQVFTHSSSPASIGHFQDLFDEHIVNGQMDESRLWNVARTQTDIRDNMCRKISSSSSGLIGYWTADESYSSSTVNDQTTPAENGTLKGAVSKITSGAPLGDDSKNLYASNWSGQKVKLTAAAGDKLIARSFTGNPYGVHVYIVNSNPYSSAGLSTTPAYYYGVFCADGIDLAKYKVKYVYSISNGTINSSNESNGELWQRADGSITTWVDLSADLDTAGNKISKSNQKTRGEYILNIVGNGKLSQDQSAYMSNGFISAFPNPVNDLLSLDLSKIRGAISSICILDVSGKVLIKTENENQFIKIDVSDFSEGIYFVEAIGDSQKCYGKFEVKR